MKTSTSSQGSDHHFKPELSFKNSNSWEKLKDPRPKIGHDNKYDKTMHAMTEVQQSTGFGEKLDLGTVCGKDVKEKTKF